MNDLQQVEEWLLDGTLFSVRMSRSIFKPIPLVRYEAEWLIKSGGVDRKIFNSLEDLVKFMQDEIVNDVHGI